MTIRRLSPFISFAALALTVAAITAAEAAKPDPWDPPCDDNGLQYGPDCGTDPMVDIRRRYWDVRYSGYPDVINKAFPPAGGVTYNPSDTYPIRSKCEGVFYTTSAPQALISFPPPDEEHCENGWFPGYPLNMDLKFGPAAGTFPPRSLDPASSSLPLLPRSAGQFRGPTSLAERPTLAGTVDLVTGVPLVQETDFELPFGSSVFRWTRTYSEFPDQFDHEYDRNKKGQDTGAHGTFDGRSFSPMQMFWDWTGQGWMIGVNPIFYFDSASWGTATTSDSESAPPTRRCYFMPDAHHAIPFETVLIPSLSSSPGVRKYAAPPRFDALLTYDGGTVDSAGEWVGEQYPSTFYVWLQNKSVKYTIKPVYEDVGYDWEGNSFHNPPAATLDGSIRFEHELSASPDLDDPVGPATSGASLGVPYYGVVTAIEDQDGNKIEIEYQDFTIVKRNDPATSSTEYWQLGQKKGQVSRIRLRSAGGDIQWTILPVYRTFGGNDRRDPTIPSTTDPTQPPTGLFLIDDYTFDAGCGGGGITPLGLVAPSGTFSTRERFEIQHAISTLYVYAGDKSAPSTDPTIPASEFFETVVPEPPTDPRAAAVERMAALAAIEASSGLIPQDWSIKVKYLYADGHPIWYQACQLMGSTPVTSTGPLDRYFQSPRLIMTTVVRKAPASATEPASESKQFALYEYAYRANSYPSPLDESTGAGDFIDEWHLRGMWSPKTVSTIYENLKASGEAEDETLLGYGAWPIPLMVKPSLEVGSGTTQQLKDTLPIVQGAGADELSNRRPRLMLSDLQFDHWVSEVAGDYYVCWESDFFDEMMNGDGSGDGIGSFFVDSSDPPKPMCSYFLWKDGPALFTDRRANANGTAYRVYRFLAAKPSATTPGIQHRLADGSIPGDPDEGLDYGPMRMALHDPFLPVNYADGTGLLSSFSLPTTGPNLADPYFVTVIDEYKAFTHATLAAEFTEWEPDRPDDTDASFTFDETVSYLKANDESYRMPRSRRMVMMNASGHVLVDRTWDLETGGVDASEGLYQQAIYDWTSRTDEAGKPLGLLKELRTYSWSAAETHASGDTTTQGVIHVFDYDPRESFEHSLAVGATGIKNGTSGSTIWKQQFIRDEDDIDQVRFQVDFLQPTTTLPDYEAVSSTRIAAQAGATPTEAINIRAVKRDAPVSGDPADTGKVTHEIVIGPPAPTYPGGTAQYPLQITHFTDDSSGEATNTWRGHGLLATVPGLSSWDGSISVSGADRFTIDLSRRTKDGKFSVDIKDYLSSTIDLHDYVSAHVSPLPSLPSGWSRIRPSATAAIDPAQNAWTFNETDPMWGPSRMIAGSRDATTAGDLYLYQSIVVEGELATEQRVYKGVTFLDDGSIEPESQPLEPGAINIIRDGASLSNQITLWHPGGVLGTPGTWTFDVIVDVKVEKDTAGQPSKLSITGADGAGVEVATQRGRFGEIVRELSPDGTITRTLSDALGRPSHVYRGTSDIHSYWGTAGPSETPDDDLTLIEKRYYSEGEASDPLDPRDGVYAARKQTAMRRFRDKPTDQYGASSNEDVIGWLERYKLDRRSRQVWSTTYQKQSGSSTLTAISSTVTWFDHLDRPRFVATFAGEPSLGAIDPATRAITSDVPTALSIVQNRPMRLQETRYNTRGQVEESRTYRCPQSPEAIPTTVEYLATLTYYDDENRPIWTRSSDSAEQRMVYNASGQLVQSVATVVDPATTTPIEVERTENELDGNGLVIRSIRRERLHDGTGATLADANSVATITFNWYDDDKRLVATAEIGTGLADGAFRARTISDTIPDRPAEPPVWSTAVSPANCPVYPRTVESWPGWTGDLEDLIPFARVTGYEYDDQGRRSEVINPDGSATRFTYNSLGQMLFKVEMSQFDPAASSVKSGVRLTAYQYDDNQLVKIAAAVEPGDIHVVNPDDSFNWSSSAIQITRLAYEAPVVGTSYGTVSANNGWIGKVFFPTNASTTDADLTYGYFPDGSVATREEARGYTHRYSYDERGNLTKAEVVTLTGTPGGDSGPSLAVDMVRRVDFVYDSISELTKATAYNSTTIGNSSWIAESTFGYNALGNLIYEQQQHGAPVISSTSPKVEYGWSFSAASSTDPVGVNRLASMLYPGRPASNLKRQVNFDYGSSTAFIDDEINCVTKMTTKANSAGSGDPDPLAAFRFMGSDRRVGKRFGAEDFSTSTFAVEQLFHTSSGAYSGLDTYGRIKDLKFTGPTSIGQQHRYEYTHDAMGNRVTAKTVQATLNSISHSNDRSYLYGYNGFQQLTQADLGQLDLSGSSPAVTNLLRGTQWNLDSLGNWRGLQGATSGNAAIGQIIATDLDGDSVADLRTVDDTSSKDNRITLRETDDTITGGSPASVNLSPVYDEAGNLIADIDYFYQYDAWNRLCKVSQRGTLTFTSAGAYQSGTVGPMLAHFTYDALGRLIRKQSPLPPNPDSSPRIRTEHYYYDGVRRIHEQFNDPVMLAEEEEFSGGGGGEGEIEEGVLISEEEEALSSGGTSSLLTVGLTWTEREYVWAPGGTGGGYVDELICQFDRNGEPYYAIQDANYNMMGLVDDTGAVVGQYTYDPYGQIVNITNKDFAGASGSTWPAIAAFNRIGHQGLFFDRFDVAGSSPSQVGQVATQAQLLPNSVGLYQNRNRSFSPSLGRYVQGDPVGTLLAAPSGAWYQRPPTSLLYATITPSLYTDGLTLYEYVNSNPALHNDPLGLMLSTLGDEGRTAAEYQQAYENGQRAMDFLNNVARGMALEQALLALAVDVAMDKFGGKVFDRVLDGAKNIQKNIRRYAARAGKEMQFGKYTVKFDRLGFPDFSPYCNGREVKIMMTGKNKADQRAADAAWEALGNPPRPKGYTWHHVEDGTTMQMIPLELNDAVKHVGGGSIIREFIDD